MAAGFGDSNDIKISVSLDTTDAVKSVEELQKTIRKTLDISKSQFQELAKYSKQLSDARTSEIKAQSQAEIGLLKEKNKIALAQIEKEIEADANKTKRMVAHASIIEARTKAASKQQISQLEEEAKNFRRVIDQEIADSQRRTRERIESLRKERAEADALNERILIKAREISEAKIAQIKTEERIRAVAEQSKIKEAEREAKRAEKLIAKQISDSERAAREIAKSQQQALGASSKSLSDIFSEGAKFGTGKGFGGILEIFTKLNPQLTSAASALYLVRGAFGAITSVVSTVAGGIQQFSRSIDETAATANKIEGLRVGFENLQRTVGQDATKSITGLRQATLGLVSDTQLYQRANQAVLLGVPTDLFNNAAAAAVKLGRAMGIDAAAGLESLSLGLGRQSRLYLDNLGIVVSAEEAYRNFAKANGIVGRELDDNEKRSAFFAEALRKIKERADELPEPIDSVGVSFQRYTIAIENSNQRALESFNQSTDLAAKYGELALATDKAASANEDWGRVRAKIAGLFRGELEERLILLLSNIKKGLADLAGADAEGALRGLIDQVKDAQTALIETESRVRSLQKDVVDAGKYRSAERSTNAFISGFTQYVEAASKGQEQLAVARAGVANGIDQLLKKEDEYTKAISTNLTKSGEYSVKLEQLGGSNDKLAASYITLRDRFKDSATAIQADRNEITRALDDNKASLQAYVKEAETALARAQGKQFLFFSQDDVNDAKQRLDNAKGLLEFFVNYVDTAREELKQPIALKVDLSSLEEARSRVPALIQGLVTQELENSGVIKIPGIDDSAIAPAVAQVEKLKKSLDLGTIKPDEFAQKYQQALEQITNAAQNVSLESIRSEVASLKDAITSGAATGVEATKQLEDASKRLAEAERNGAGISVEANKQIEKIAKAAIKRGQEASQATITAQKKAGREVDSELKRQQREFEKFARNVNRALGTAIPRDVQKKLVDLFNSGKRGTKEFEEALIDLGKQVQKTGGDIGALQKEISDLAELQDRFPDIKIIDSAAATKDLKDLEDALASSGIFNLNKLSTGNTTGGFFGYDIGDFITKEGEMALADQFQQVLSTAFQTGSDGFTSEDVPVILGAVGSAIGAAIGTYIAGPVGGQIGAIAGQYAGQALGNAIVKKDEYREKVKEFFGDVFGATGIGVVVQEQVVTGVTDGVNGAITELRPVFRQLPGLDVININNMSLDQYVNSLQFVRDASDEVKASFKGAADAFAAFLDTPSQKGDIFFSLLTTLQGDLQNLQVLIQATGVTLEEFQDKIIEAFLAGALSIQEAYNALVQITNLYEEGIPGAVGAVTEAITNLNNSLQSDSPGRYAVDSLRDVGAEAREAGRTFDSVVNQLAQTFGFSAQQTQLLFQAFRAAGITSLLELQKASDAQLLTILENIRRVREESAQTEADLAKPPVIQSEIKDRPVSSGVKKETPAQKAAREAAELLKKQVEEAYKLTVASQKYADIIDKINKGVISELKGQQQIVALRNKILALVQQQQKYEQLYQAELAKGTGANLQLLESYGEMMRRINRQYDRITKSAERNKDAFKELDLKGVIPVIRDINNLGVVARLAGVDLEKNIDILVKGFLQGRLSIREVNDEIAKTKDLLGPGIPKSVGDVTQAFKNLLDAGTQGGAFSLDAFTDIFAEFREKFNKEGSALREAERQQLVDNLETAKIAFKTAVGPEALEKARAALELAKKARDDFYASQPKPQLDDLRAELEKTFGKGQVDIFFQALAESGLRTFDDFEKAGADSVIAILGRLEELGFQFNKTSDDITKTNERLRNAEQKANAGFDPLKEAIQLVKDFNNGAGQLPAAFNDTSAAIDGLSGPLAKLAKGFDNIIEKLAKLSGNTFENDVVFNVRTVGDQTSKNLIEVIYGNGALTGGDTGGNGPNQSRLDTRLRQAIDELEKLKRAGKGQTEQANRVRERIRRLRERGAR